MSGISVLHGRPVPSGLAVIYSQHEKKVEFTLHGELTLGNADQLEREVTRMIRTRLEGIVIDIGPLVFADLVGVRTLLAICDWCEASRTEITFRGVAAPQVVKILSLAGSDERLGLV